MKPAALFIVPAALLTVTALHGVSAAPNNKVPVTIDTARTLSCTVQSWNTDADGKTSLSSIGHEYFARPGKMRSERFSTLGTSKDKELDIDDGKNFYGYLSTRNDYATWVSNGNVAAKWLGKLPSDKGESVVLNGKSALHYTQTRTPNSQLKIVDQSWYDNVTHLPLQTIGTFSGKEHSMNFSFKIVYSNWELNAPLPASLFTFVPPPGSKLRPTPKREAYDAKFLKPGAPAPNFTAYDGNGKAVHLSDYAGKLVLIDFWATWCGPCQDALPDTNTIAKKYAGQVVTLGVNVWDEQSAFANWLPSHKNLDNITFVREGGPRNDGVADKVYGLVAIPSQYVIGKDGKVAAAYCGASAEDVADAVNKALQAKTDAP